MLENVEVDDDYFTPVAKTSLANIFKKHTTGEKSENETLKYTPPLSKPPQVPEEPPKMYENMFSCILDAYQWYDNAYTHRGKLGCAVVKHNTGEHQCSHNIVLYDSKKATMSSALATNTLQVTVQGKDVISYYDLYGKYWYLRGTVDNVTKLTEILTQCSVSIKVINEQNQGLPELVQPEEEVKTVSGTNIMESDTDSSINKKTKASILNRMATMGQSVLPPRPVSNDPSSDSDANVEKVVAVRHKPMKIIGKKNLLEKPDYHKTDVLKDVNPPPEIKNTERCVGIDTRLQLQSSASTPIVGTSGHDLNYFLAEQRISNSELRINMTRITDKVDSILDKVSNLEKNKNEGSAINIMIYQKLINEYEIKIKTYEELLEKINKNPKNIPTDDDKMGVLENNELIKLNNRITELDNSIIQKDREISVLNDEIKKLKEINKSEKSQDETELEIKVAEYEKLINENTEKISILSEENDELTRKHTEQFGNRIKSIMNETFRAIEINFDNNETYSGETINNIIGTIIKRVTIASLK